jgi:hypothetical protein
MPDINSPIPEKQEPVFAPEKKLRVRARIMKRLKNRPGPNQGRKKN